MVLVATFLGIVRASAAFGFNSSAQLYPAHLLTLHLFENDVESETCDGGRWQKAHWRPMSPSEADPHLSIFLFFSFSLGHYLRIAQVGRCQWHLVLLTDPYNTDMKVTSRMWERVCNSSDVYSWVQLLGDMMEGLDMTICRPEQVIKWLQLYRGENFGIKNVEHGVAIVASMTYLGRMEAWCFHFLLCGFYLGMAICWPQEQIRWLWIIW